MGRRYLGEFPSTPDAVAKLVRKLADHWITSRRCTLLRGRAYGYGLYRQILAMEHACAVVVPNLT